jgi:hypothetical protein
MVPDPWQVDVLRGWLGVRDRRWAASRCGTACPRQNGKNGVAEIRELYGMVALGERILHTAHEVKTARKAFARLLEFFDDPRSYPELHDMVREIRRTNGQEAIVLRNGGQVEFAARTKSSGRGFSVDVLLADEAQELTEDQWAALRPTIAASANPQVILLGTPPPPGEAGEVFARFRRAALEGVDGRLCWDEWSCSDDLSVVDLDSRAEWAARNPALGTRLREDTVADERAEMDDQTFARERLGWWQPKRLRHEAVLPGWDVLAAPNSPRGRDLVWGVDVAEDRTASIVVAWRTAAGVHGEMGVPGSIPSHRLVERLVELVGSHGGRVAAPTALKDDLERAGLPVEEVRSAVWPVACGALVDAATAGTLRHGNQPELNEAVQAVRWGPTTTAGVRGFLLRDSPGAGPLFALVRAAHVLNDVQPGDFYTL